MKTIETLFPEPTPFVNFLQAKIASDQNRIETAKKLRAFVNSNPSNYFLKYGEDSDLILFRQVTTTDFTGTVICLEEVARLSQLLDRQEWPSLLALA